MDELDELELLCRAAEDSECDRVNHPSHYAGHTGIEAMDALESCMGKDAMVYFFWGNAFKYLWRWKFKNGVEDLEKCRFYINKLIDSSEGGNHL